MDAYIPVFLILGVIAVIGLVLRAGDCDPLAGLDFSPHTKELDCERDKRWHDRRVAREFRFPDRRIHQRRSD